MRESKWTRVQTVSMRHSALVLAAVWTSIVGASLLWNVGQLRRGIRDLARAEARGVYNKDLVYRRWIAAQGGVYVPVTEEMPPNPYLANIEERDITTPSGRQLTLVNPAYMTRMVHELGKEQYGARGHVTSLNPIRPENAPDPWETEALRAFQRGEPEIDSVEVVDGAIYLRLMRPMITEEGCLKCHAAQGYEVGDIRGGMSISVPMEPYQAVARAHMFPLALGHGVLWILGLGGIGLGTTRIRERIREREQAYEEREKVLSDLQDRVKELRCMYGIADSIRKRETLDAMFDEVITLIPNGWRYPEITRGRVRFNEDEYVSAPFDETKWHLASDIVVNGEVSGSVEVYYIEERPPRDEGPFLGEERRLIDAIARMLSSGIERKQAEDTLRDSQAELSSIFENVPVAMILVDRDRRVRKVNRSTVEFMDRPAEQMVGLRGGEALRCLHSLDDPKGCGFGPFCETCPVRRTVMATFETGESHFRVEAELPFDRAEKEELLTFLVSTAVIDNPEGRLVLVCIEDITDRRRAEGEVEKHREHLEEMVRQRTGKLQKMIDLMADREMRMVELKKVIRELCAQLESAGFVPAVDDPLKQVEI